MAGGQGSPRPSSPRPGFTRPELPRQEFTGPPDPAKTGVMTTVAPLPTFADVQAAARRLEGIARRTPLLESEALNALTGGRVLLKAEPLQRTGSFKFRGAYNAISQLVAQRGRRLLLGQPRPGGRRRRAGARQARDHRDAGGRPGDQAREHAGAGRQDPALRPANGSRARRLARRSLAQRTGAALVRPYDDPQ